MAAELRALRGCVDRQLPDSMTDEDIKKNLATALGAQNKSDGLFTACDSMFCVFILLGSVTRPWEPPRD